MKKYITPKLKAIVVKIKPFMNNTSQVEEIPLEKDKGPFNAKETDFVDFIGNDN